MLFDFFAALIVAMFSSFAFAGANVNLRCYCSRYQVFNENSVVAQSVLKIDTTLTLTDAAQSEFKLGDINSNPTFSELRGLETNLNMIFFEQYKSLKEETENIDALVKECKGFESEPVFFGCRPVLVVPKP